jgi:hypothetical protein
MREHIIAVKIISWLLFSFAVFSGSFAGQIANVDFIHRYISQKHSLSVAIADASQTYWAANRKYLLCTIDAANKILNEFESTSYCSSRDYADGVAVDTIASIYGIDNLIKKLEACERPCDSDIYDNGKVMKCENNKFSCIWLNCDPDMGAASCGCPEGMRPDGEGGCETVSPCTNNVTNYDNGKICTCVDGVWQCNVNCPVCDKTCGCPSGKIPDGAGNCVVGEEPCIQGDVKYLLDNGSIMAQDCPMSGFRDDCPLINNKVTCSDYTNRTGYGAAYIEDCCSDQNNSTNKSDPLGGKETSFIQGKAYPGVRIVFIQYGADNTLIINKGQCRRPYSYYNPQAICRQRAREWVASFLDCTSGLQLNSNVTKYMKDFPLI